MHKVYFSAFYSERNQPSHFTAKIVNYFLFCTTFTMQKPRLKHLINKIRA